MTPTEPIGRDAQMAALPTDGVSHCVRTLLARIARDAAADEHCVIMGLRVQHLERTLPEPDDNGHAINVPTGEADLTIRIRTSTGFLGHAYRSAGEQ